MPAQRTELEQIVRTLESWERGSASEGERRAAEWIAGRLRELGYEPKIEEHPAHGGYWWPLGLLSGLGAVGALLGGRAGGGRSGGDRAGGDRAGGGRSAARRSRRGGFGGRAAGTLLGAFSAFGIWDELGLWRGHWTRALLPKRTTANVHAFGGDPDADRTVVLVAHHDAAHTGAIFDFSLIRWYGRTFPDLVEKGRKWPGLNWLTFIAPVLVALGSLLGRPRLRRVGGLMCAGGVLTFADVGRSAVVPGANDNLSAVAAILEVARALRDEPVEGVRVVILSNGSEESFEEGMAGFVKAHEHELPRDRTDFIVLDSVGSPRLILLEGEGMLLLRPYDEALKDDIAAAAEEIDTPIIREHWLSFASDALIALRKGYRTATIASFDEFKLPTNYHQPTDVADNLHWDTVEAAANVTEAAVRRIARTRRPPQAS